MYATWAEPTLKHKDQPLTLTRGLQAQLSIMEAIHKDNRCTQRELSTKTGLPLSYINRCLKELICRELIKVKTLTGKRLLYILTPQGMSEKASLTFKSFRRLVSSYQQIRQMASDVCSELKQMDRMRLALCGASSEAEVVYLAAIETGLEVACIVDDRNTGNRWLQLSIEPIETLSASTYDQVIISDMERFGLLACRLQDVGVPLEKISLYTGQNLQAATGNDPPLQSGPNG